MKYWIFINKDKTNKIVNLIDCFNSNPCLVWELNKKLNRDRKDIIIFTMFNKVSYLQAKKIIRLTRNN